MSHSARTQLYDRTKRSQYDQAMAQVEERHGLEGRSTTDHIRQTAINRFQAYLERRRFSVHTVARDTIDLRLFFAVKPHRSMRGLLRGSVLLRGVSTPRRKPFFRSSRRPPTIVNVRIPLPLFPAHWIATSTGLRGEQDSRPTGVSSLGGRPSSFWRRMRLTTHEGERGRRWDCRR